MKKIRKNLALLVPVLTILAMGLVGCANKDDGEGSSPVAVTFKTVVTRGESSYAISTDGKLYTWGANKYGQLGDGTTDNHNTPKQIMAGTTFKTFVARVDANGGRQFAISTAGKLYAWGRNKYGQLGDGTTTNRHTPTEIMAGIKTVVASDYHTLAISTDGKLYAWGSNGAGQLGDGTTTNSHTPKQIMVAGTTFKTVVASADSSSYAISTDGKLYAWGYNYYGQLGDGTTANKKVPTEIMAGTTFKTVVASDYHALAISTAGKLYAWGNNYSGQLGDGTTTNRHTPTEIMAGTTFQTVVASGSISKNSTFAISTDGKLYAWGSNGAGQLGNGKSGSGEKEVTPQEIMAGTTFKTVVGSNGSSSYAISTDGKLYAWGDNLYGQLGNGKAGVDEKEVTPQKIMAGTTFKTVVASISSSYAISTDGKLYAWGDNRYGQLGNGKAGYDENYNREKEVTPQLIEVYE